MAAFRRVSSRRALGLVALAALLGLATSGLLHEWMRALQAPPVGAGNRPGSYARLAPSDQRVRVPKSSRTVHLVWGLWDTTTPPPRVLAEARRWEALNEGWTARVWTAAELEATVSKTCPWLVRGYLAAKPIQRADLGRLAVVYAHGGMYADIDVEPGRIEPALRARGYDPAVHSTVVLEEDVMTPALSRQCNPECISTRIANFAFFATPGAPVLMASMRLAETRLNIFRTNHADWVILYTTGPDITTEAVFSRPGTVAREDVLVLPRVRVWRGLHTRLTPPFANGGAGSWRAEK